MKKEEELERGHFREYDITEGKKTESLRSKEQGAIQGDWRSRVFIRKYLTMASKLVMQGIL